jgi:hypothetical protein
LHEVLVRGADAGEGSRMQASCGEVNVYHWNLGAAGFFCIRSGAGRVSEPESTQLMRREWPSPPGVVVFLQAAGSLAVRDRCLHPMKMGGAMAF